MAVALRDDISARRAWPRGARVALPAVGSDVRITIAGLLIGAGTIGGMLAGSSLMTTAAAGAALLAAVVSPPIGLVALSFLGPLRMPLVIPPPGLYTILVAAIILGAVMRLPRERLLPASSGRALRIGAPLVIAAGFLLYALLQQLPEMATGYASEAAHDIGFLFYQLATGFGAIIAAGMVIRGRSPYPYLTALLAAALFASLLAIVTADGIPFSRLQNLIPLSDGDGRATGPFGNPNSFGQFLGYAATLAIGLTVFARRWRYRVPLIATIVVFGYGMFISLSRGGIAALVAGVIVLAFTRSRRTGIVTAVAALVLALVVYPAFVQSRLTTLEGTANQAAQQTLAQSDGGRLEAVLAAPSLFALSPVFGIGFGQYKFMAPQVTENHVSLVAHNWYGTVFAEQGLLGVALWGLLMISVIVAIRRRPDPGRSVGLGVFASLAVGSFFLQPPTLFQLSVLPIIAVTAAIVGVWGGQGRPPKGAPAPVPPRGGVRRLSGGVRPMADPTPAD